MDLLDRTALQEIDILVLLLAKIRGEEVTLVKAIFHKKIPAKELWNAQSACQGLSNLTVVIYIIVIKNMIASLGFTALNAMTKWPEINKIMIIASKNVGMVQIVIVNQRVLIIYVSSLIAMTTPQIHLLPKPRETNSKERSKDRESMKNNLRLINVKREFNNSTQRRKDRNSMKKNLRFIIVNRKRLKNNLRLINVKRETNRIERIKSRKSMNNNLGLINLKLINWKRKNVVMNKKNVVLNNLKLKNGKEKDQPCIIKKPQHIKFYSKTNGVRIKVDFQKR